MFTKPRPVPSKAALRVLYQLAYISSGTAVGVGVLCAEERRRRTQIVQRVADNARKIRQHPRYVANAALAVRENEGSGEGVSEDERASQAVDAVGRHGRGRRGKSREQVVKGQELPSVVEQEYDAVAAGERKRGSRRGRNGTGHAGAGQAMSGTEATSQPIQTPPIQPARERFVPLLNGAAQYRSNKPTKGSVHPKNPLSTEQQLQPSDADSEFKTERSKAASLADRKRVSQEDGVAHCKKLLDDHRVTEALEFANSCSHISPGFMPKRLFDAALERNMFGECAALLRLKPSYTPGFGSRLRSLILACSRHGEYDVLLDFFYRGNRTSVPVPDDSLHQELRWVLATACATDDGLSHHFERLYGSLSTPFRKRVVEELCHALRTTWRVTKNTDAVLKQLRPITRHLDNVGDAAALRLVDQTMVEIYVKADRTIEAMDTIARLHRADPSDILSALRAATVYATRQAWGPFHQAVRIAASAPMSELTKNQRKALHGVILAYLPHHSPAQVWKFVTYLQDTFALRLYPFASRLILGLFVDRKAVTLIPAWLHRMRIAGQDSKLDDKTAVHLLSRYYLQFRPSHVLVMWFCRNLTHLVPSFDPTSFYSLIQQSIACDLSGYIERNSPWQREHTQQRLDRLRDAADHIPSPGYKYSRRLYFQHPGSDPQEPLARADGQQAGSDEAGSHIERGVDHRAEAVEHAHEPFVGVSRWQAGSVEDGSRIERRAEDGADAVQNMQDSKADLPSLESLLMPAMIGGQEVGGIVDRMAVQLSSKRYKAVLHLYDRCLDKRGIPSSIDALIMAVRASIKLYGDDGHAQHIIERAEQAGVNAMRAMVPVIIHRMRKLDPTRLDGARQLLDAAARYYKAGGDRLDGDTSSHVGVTAANLLITNGWPGYGVTLLQKMLEESQACKRSVEIVFTIVMIKGYVALGNIRDVLYWVREILRLDVQIRPHLLRVLKRALKIMQLSHRDRAHLVMSIAVCEARRQKQAFEAKILGKKLVSVIARCMREETTIDVGERAQLDRELFGPTIERRRSDGGTSSDFGQAPPETDSPTNYERLLRNKKRVAEAIRMDPDAAPPDDRRQAERLSDERWLRQYRAFLRKPMVMDDGRRASFRYFMPTESQSRPAQGRAARRRLGLAERKARSERVWEVGPRSAVWRGGGLRADGA